MVRKRGVVECSFCGEPMPVGRPACPACGSDAETGWKDGEELDYQSVEIPDTWPPDGLDVPSRRRWNPGGVWWWVAVVALVAFVLAVVL